MPCDFPHHAPHKRDQGRSRPQANSRPVDLGRGRKARIPEEEVTTTLPQAQGKDQPAGGLSSGMPASWRPMEALQWGVAGGTTVGGPGAADTGRPRQEAQAVQASLARSPRVPCAFHPLPRRCDCLPGPTHLRKRRQACKQFGQGGAG